MVRIDLSLFSYQDVISSTIQTHQNVDPLATTQGFGFPTTKPILWDWEWKDS